VLVTEPSVAQPYLPAGRYHWDGWIEKRFVAVVPHGEERKGEP